jgi:hypothetical protein
MNSDSSNNDAIWNTVFQQEMIAFNNLTMTENLRLKRSRIRDDDDEPSECLDSDFILFNVRPLQVRKICDKIEPIRCLQMYENGADTPKKGYVASCWHCIRLSRKCTILPDCQSCEYCSAKGCDCLFIPKNTLTKYDLMFTNNKNLQSL